MSLSLPTLTSSPKPVPTAKDYEEGTKLRGPAREALLRNQDIWVKQFQPLNAELKVPSSVTNPIAVLFSRENEWYKNNVKVTVDEMKTHAQTFTESYELLYKAYNEKVKEMLVTLDPLKAKPLVEKWPDQVKKKEFLTALRTQIKTSEKDKKTKELQEQNKDIGTVAWEAFKDTLKYAGIIAYILLALSLASFSASENLYKEKAYILLNYAYVFVFAPIFFFYYTYRLISFYIFNGPEIRMEALVFPVFPYSEKPVNEITMLETFFGYMETPKLLSWMSMKRETEKEERIDFLKTEYLEKLAAEKAEARGGT